VCSYICEGPNHVAPLSSVQLDVFFFCPFLFVCNTVGIILLCFPGPSETVRGSNFCDWTGNVFPNRLSDFFPRMAKGGVC
jgi:hypothetical protein